MKLNRKGFTLVEMLATVALLSIISIISFVSISSIIKESKVNDCKNLQKNIISSTKEYFGDKIFFNSGEIL